MVSGTRFVQPAPEPHRDELVGTPEVLEIIRVVGGINRPARTLDRHMALRESVLAEVIDRDTTLPEILGLTTAREEASPA